MVHWVQDSRK